MSKSFKNKDKFEDNEAICLVRLDQVRLPPKLLAKLIARDRAQIEEMRRSYESGRSMVRVVLRSSACGGFDIEDGRHRVIAAKLAGLTFIEALIV